MSDRSLSQAIGLISRYQASLHLSFVFCKMGNTVTTITVARTPWSEMLWDLDESTRCRFPAVASKHEYVFNILLNSVFKWLGWDANLVCFLSQKAVFSIQEAPSSCSFLIAHACPSFPLQMTLPLWPSHFPSLEQPLKVLKTSL